MGVPLRSSWAFISGKDNVTWGDFEFLHAVFLFHDKMVLCFHATCGPQALRNLLFGSHIFNLQILQKNFSLPTHNATHVLCACTFFSSCWGKKSRIVITIKHCVNKRTDFSNCQQPRKDYEITNGTKTQDSTVVKDLYTLGNLILAK